MDQKLQKGVVDKLEGPKRWGTGSDFPLFEAVLKIRSIPTAFKKPGGFLSPSKYG